MHVHRSLFSFLHELFKHNTVEPPIEDIIGTQLAVLFREVSLFQSQICTQLYVFGTADSALIREMPLIQSALYREVPLYYRV